MSIGSLLTTTEVAKRLGVTEGRVRQLYLEKRLMGRKVGTILLFSEDVVDAFKAIDRPSGRPRQPA